MRTEESLHRPVSVFFFAHQDDECGVYEQIHVELKRGHRPLCIYMTTGVQPGLSSLRRNSESQAVLQSLGVQSEDIVFAGDLLGIADGALIGNLAPVSVWLEQYMPGMMPIANVYVPAWEGGHPDHDLLHAIVIQLCCDRVLISSVFQYSLYNAYRCAPHFFRVFSPLRENGPITRNSISWRRRIKFLSYALSYPSQWRSWVGLFPFFLMHYVFFGWQDIQPVRVERLRDRPHKGLLYYETRQFSTWTNVASAIESWMANRLAIQPK